MAPTSSCWSFRQPDTPRLQRRWRRILLTGSGGPFRTFARAALKDVTPEKSPRNVQQRCQSSAASLTIRSVWPSPLSSISAARGAISSLEKVPGTLLSREMAFRALEVRQISATLAGAAVALVLANLVPLAGVLLWEWSVSSVVILYWFENVVIGVVNVLRMTMASPAFIV